MGRARFLSHLDTMRVFQRALTRARIPAAYSQGFNPHMRLSVAFPLPLGAESVCEIIDLKLEHPAGGLVNKLNAALPEGFEILRTLPLFNLDKITHIRYALAFDREFENIFDGRALVIPKKTKRGVVDLDIAPHIRNAITEGAGKHPPSADGALFAKEGKAYCVRIDLSVKPPQVSPAHVLAALKAFCPDIEMIYARRLEMIVDSCWLT